MHNNNTAHDILADLEAALDKSKRTGDTLTARCPAHKDKSPSLSVTIGDNADRVLLKCFSGCQAEDITHALGWKMRDLFATDDAWRSHVARDIADESTAASREDAQPLPSDVPGRVQSWVASLKAAAEDVDSQLRILYLIAESPEWATLEPALRIAVIGATKGTVRGMAVAILGRFDDRQLTWREPIRPAAADTSEPDVVSLETLLSNPLDPSVTVARGLAFGGTMGFIRGPKASGKTTILAAAAARVSRGQPWAGQDTEAGTVLVVRNDDPRSWVLALRDFGADPGRILMAQARVVSKPGKLAALIAEHQPAWVIIDNLRTWCRAMQLDTDNSSAAASAIDPIAEAVRECGYPVACTIVHNEARSKGVTSDPYAGRMRNSTVFEDAADFIIGCAHADGSTETTITAGEKTRREIPTETLIIDLDADGHGAPGTGGGGGRGADPFTTGEQGDQTIDEKITGFLMSHAEGSTQRAVLNAVSGARRAHLVDRLNVVGTLGADKRWRRATNDLSQPTKQAIPESQPGGGGTRGSGGVIPVIPVIPTHGDQGGITLGIVTHPIGGSVPGIVPGDHPRVTDHSALADTENTPTHLPLGGDLDTPVEHEKNCPGGCGGRGTVDGTPCAWGKCLEDRKRMLRPVEPVAHPVSSGSEWSPRPAATAETDDEASITGLWRFWTRHHAVLPADVGDACEHPISGYLRPDELAHWRALMVDYRALMVDYRAYEDARQTLVTVN